MNNQKNTILKKAQADTKVNELYGVIRNRFGSANSSANGYRFEQYFLNEQKIVLPEIADENEIIIDLACGSGLMAKPLDTNKRLVIGIDFNEIACKQAKNNKIRIIRGDVYSVPLADSSVDRVINCQFLNQQPHEKAKYLLNEVYRILKPGGRLIMIWRNDRALVHKLAVFIYRYIDKLTGRPEFPYYDNYIADLVPYCREIGFSIINEYLSFPLFSWKFNNLDTIGAKTLGASCCLIVEK